MVVTLPSSVSPLTESTLLWKPTKTWWPVSTAHFHILFKDHRPLSTYFRGDLHICLLQLLKHAVPLYSVCPCLSYHSEGIIFFSSECLRFLRTGPILPLKPTTSKPSFPGQKKGQRSLPHGAELPLSQWPGPLWESSWASLPVLSAL